MWPLFKIVYIVCIYSFSGALRNSGTVYCVYTMGMEKLPLAVRRRVRWTERIIFSTVWYRRPICWAESAYISRRATCSATWGTSEWTDRHALFIYFHGIRSEPWQTARGDLIAGKALDNNCIDRLCFFFLTDTLFETKKALQNVCMNFNILGLEVLPHELV